MMVLPAGIGAARPVQSGGGGGGYLGVTITKVTTASTSQIISLGPYSAGDLLIIQWSSQWGFGNGVTTPAGWTLINNSVGGTRQLFCYRVMDGTEGSTVTVTYGTSALGIAAVHRIEAGKFHASTAPAFQWSQGSNAAPDSPNLSPAWGSADTIWISTFHADGNLGVSAFPFAGNQASESFGSSPWLTLGSCWEKVVAASNNPSAFTMSGSSSWMSHTIAVRPP